MKKTLILLCLLGLLPSAVLTPSVRAAVEDEVNWNPPIVYVVPIRGMIEPALLYVIRRGVTEAQAAKAHAIIFVMDTPGGTLNAASDIVKLIQKVPIQTYTLVENHGFSAGALIALATKHIYMAPGSVIGDAMPIMVSPLGGAQEMPEDIKEKMVSAVSALARSAAETSGHNPDLAEKMVRREIALVIDGEEISPAGQLLTLTNKEAERRTRGGRHLLSEGTVEDVNGLLARLELRGATVRELEVTTAERVARFIAMLAPLFLMGGLLGIYIEIKTPGFGVPGILGIICLAIFFWGHHIAGLAGLEDVVIFLVGVVLLLIEILVIPGFGVVGVAGMFLMLWAIMKAMIQHAPGMPWYPSWPDLQAPILKLSVALVGSAVVAAFIGRWLPRSKTFGRLILQKSTARREGYAASEDTRPLIGLFGTTFTALRPAGSAIFGERKIDVVTKGEYIPGGTRIRIVESHGSRIIVEAVESKVVGEKA